MTKGICKRCDKKIWNRRAHAVYCKECADYLHVYRKKVHK